jgi:hypothetical protein
MVKIERKNNMDEYLDKIATKIECKLDDELNIETLLGVIWGYKTERVDNNNVTIEIKDNKMKTHKYKISIEKI